MVKAESPQPSRAELHISGTHSRATFSARQRFLDLIGEIAKEVISDLRQKALTPFRILQVSSGWVIADAIASRGERTPFETIRLKAEGAEGSNELLEALEAWQNKWRLRAPWIENAVLQALNHWSRQPDSEIDEGSWPPYEQRGWVPKGGDPPSLRAYNPYKESRSDYKAEMLVELDAYAAEVEQATHERLGAEGWPKQTSQGNRPDDQHLRWLLRYLIGETQYQISFRPEGTEPDAPPRSEYRTSAVHVSTVRRGIKKAAEQLGLTRP